MVNAAEVSRRLGMRVEDRSTTVPCPVCQPEKRRDQMALSITVRSGLLLLKCHKSNCNYRTILDAIGIRMEIPEHPEVGSSLHSPNNATRLDEARRRLQEERDFRQKRAARAATVADTILARSTKQAGHPYMVRKGFARHEAPCISMEKLIAVIVRPRMFAGYPDDASILLVPLRINGATKSLQMIGPDGTKVFLAGSITKGAAFVMAGSGPVITSRIVCEGYATGLAAYYAAKHEGIESIDIICAMTASNMRDISRSMRCTGAIADNDESGTGEKAVRSLSIPFAMPDKTGDDFNDLWRSSPVVARRMVRWLTTQTQTRRTLRYDEG